MPALLVFVLMPLIEIALFIAIGGEIGVGATLALIVLSALLGAAILRGQRSRAVAMMQGGLRVAPGTFVAQGAFSVLSGILLILPGFLTDALGLVLLIPPLQRAIVRGIGARTTVVTTSTYRRGDVVDGEFTVHEPRPDPIDPDHRIDDRRP
ncbi:FxsA family protein [Pararhodobacter marinus]|uniref:Exclusion protein FxsA n=1 Tax=Pararhodobacter marinus TaxID=2184063 RepID=A0A2U2CIR1_9RHOB|nr:FxsA family protein [Pararhodobacter marinus]PWE31770.1 exclusion protein FxsA [Pararhodobacter marinus]